MDVPLEEPSKFSLTSVEDCAPLIGGEAAERILTKAERLRTPAKASANAFS